MACRSSPFFRGWSRCCRWCRKPIQYVGGELNARSRTGTTADVRWALMYPDAYEVGLPNQGVMILYEVLNEQPGRPRRAHVRRLARPGGADARARRPAVHRRRAPAGRRFDLLGVCFSHRARLHQHAHRARPRRHPAARARTATDEHPIVIAGGHAAFNPEPIADFIDAAVLGDGEQAVLEITDVVRDWKAEGSPGGRDELLLRLARTGGVYVPQFYDVDYLPGRPDPAGRAQPARRAVAGHQAHRDGPRRVALPEAAARAARRDGARADVASRSSAAAPAAAGSARPA